MGGQYAPEYTGKIYIEINAAFGHTGVFSYFMVIVLPIVWFTIFRVIPDLNAKYNHAIVLISRFVFPIWFILVGLISLVNQNRTAVGCLILLSLYFLFQSLLVYKSKRQWVWLGFVLVAPLIIFKFIYYLVALKPLSSISRKLFLEIILNQTATNLLRGTGFGRFTWYYPQWQASYFQNHIDVPIDYVLASGETYLMFNEYIQLALEAGIIIFLTYNIVHIYIFFFRSKQYGELLKTLKITLVLIWICGLINYSLHVSIIINIFFICLFLSLMIVWQDKEIALHRTRPVVLIYSYAIILIALFIPNIQYLSRVLEWRQLKRISYTLPYISNKLKYDIFYSTLFGNTCFLYDYGQLLLKDTTHSKLAIDVFERLNQKKITRASVQCLANAYNADRQYDKAIEQLKWITEFLPNRFSPKAELLSSYIATGKTTEARQLSQTILDMPIKIPSPEVNFIRNYAKEYLTK